MCINKYLKRLTIAFVLVGSIFFNSLLIAQTASTSPYSRYGVGDLNNKGLAQSFALGGTHIAVQNDSTPMFLINAANPASYSNIRLTTADLGLGYSRLQLENANAKTTTHSAALSHIAIGLPLTKWWGLSFGLLPYSTVGYKVSDQQEIANVGTVNFLYEGTGGLNQAFIGNGIKPLYGLPRKFSKTKKYKALISNKKADSSAKTEAEILADIKAARKIYKRRKNLQNLSLGLNVSYLFGNIENSARSIFPGGLLAFNTRTYTTKRVKDIYFDYGIQHAFVLDSFKHRELKEKVSIIWGATFTAQTNVKSKIDSLSYSYFNSSTGYEIIKDTIVNSNNVDGTITLPLSFGFGIAFKKGDKWMVAADYIIQNWSSYQAFNQSQGLKNSMRATIGVQYVPNSKAVGLENYKKRIHYRAGLKYYQSAIELKSTPLIEYAVTAGVGLPVGRNYLLQNFSMVNIGVEYGQRGTTTNGLIKENILKVSLGFTINDRWFVKPKYD